MKPGIDFYIHWLWTATFAILALSGFALMGARYGWLMNYSLAVADYLHRTLAALFVFLLAAGIFLEILRLVYGLKVFGWMIIGTKPFQVFTLITTLLLVFSGVLIWICMDRSAVTLTFSMMVHEIVSFIALGSIIWHIYEKTHVLKL